MTDEAFDFLQQLLEAPSPSGYEAPARALLRQRVESLADRVEVDMLGNLVATLEGQGEGRPRLMLTAHCDEIGFLVRYIDDRGFIYFAPVGGVDAHLVPGQRVSLQTANGPLRGVVGKKPIHLMDAKDRERVVPISEQFIDIGCSDGEEARALVAIGDPVVFAAGLERLQGSRVTSRARGMIKWAPGLWLRPFVGWPPLTARPRIFMLFSVCRKKSACVAPALAPLLSRLMWPWLSKLATAPILQPTTPS